MELVDTHAHLNDDQFADDLDMVLARARAADVRAIVAVGITADTSRQVLELARRNPLVHAAAGIHPNHAGAESAKDWLDIEQMARDARIVAIGETGLDRFRNDTSFDR